MKILAADEYVMCCGLLRTLMLLYDNVCVTSANSIDEVLTSILELPDLDLVLLDTSMARMLAVTSAMIATHSSKHVPQPRWHLIYPCKPNITRYRHQRWQTLCALGAS